MRDKIRVETAWTSTIVDKCVHLRCLTGAVATVADRLTLQEGVEAGEGEVFVGPLADAQEVARGTRGKSRWRVVLLHLVGATGTAHVPVLRVGTRGRVRVTDGRASKDESEALAYALELATEVQSGLVELSGRRRRASSIRAQGELVAAFLTAAKNREVHDLESHVALMLRGWHEADVALAAMAARQVRDLLQAERVEGSRNST